jgi:hypothetical protein
MTLLRETENPADYAEIGNRVINRSVNVNRLELASCRAALNLSFHREKNLKRLTFYSCGAICGSAIYGDARYARHDE